MGSGTNVGNSQQQKSTLYLDFVGANNQRRYQLEGHFKPNLSPRISPWGKQDFFQFRRVSVQTCADSLSSRIAVLQTLGTYEGKQMVLAVTLSDGNNVKYFISFRRFGYAVHSDSLKHASNESGSPCGSKAYIVGVFLNTAGQTPFNSYLLPYWYITCALLAHHYSIMF